MFWLESNTQAISLRNGEKGLEWFFFSSFGCDRLENKNNEIRSQPTEKNDGTKRAEETPHSLNTNHARAYVFNKFSYSINFLFYNFHNMMRKSSSGSVIYSFISTVLKSFVRRCIDQKNRIKLLSFEVIHNFIYDPFETTTTWKKEKHLLIKSIDSKWNAYVFVVSNFLWTLPKWSKNVAIFIWNETTYDRYC